VINSFKNFLVEEEKTLYVVWGRMNPPTAGHEKLLDFAKQKAGKNPLRIYLTQTVDSKKNPLAYKTKIKFARKGFPKYARQIMMDPKIRTIFDAMTSFYNEGFKKIVIIAGEDRVREYDVTLNKFNGKKARHGFYNFQAIEVLNAGKRDPEAAGVEGVSGTKLRKFATDGDFSGFSQFMPKALSNAETKEVFNAVRKGMGLDALKEYRAQVNLQPVSEIRESYVNGELFKEGDTVVIKETGEIAKVKNLGSNYVIVEGSGNQYRKWLDAVERIDEPKVDYETADFSVKLESLSEDVKNFKKFSEQSIELTRTRISREKEVEKRKDKADKIRHDRMLDRARMARTRAVNRRTKEV
jgi:hypothetical protein